MILFPKYTFVLIFLCFWTACYAQNKNIGDSCNLPVRGTGVCKKISECPKAKKQNSVGIRPTICNRKSGIVVCCDGQPSAAPERIQPRIVPVDPTIANLRKSQQKCREYSSYVQTTSYAAPLSIDSSIIKSHTSTNCIFELKPLIYGGSLAAHGEFPHMALLGNGTPRNWFCGGSLISEQFVLTAAHCNQARVGAVSVVRLGELNIVKPELNSEPEDIDVLTIIIHPEYVRTQVYNDIALIKLVRRIRISTYIRPACLWNKYDIVESNAVAAGWGKTENVTDKLNDDLLKVGLSIVEQNKCKDLYKNYTSQKLREIRPSLMCADNATGGDTCQGDSGGPLEISDPQNKCIHYIIGVTSAGRGCGFEIPGLYTRVSYYIDWIEGIVWP